MRRLNLSMSPTWRSRLGVDRRPIPTRRCVVEEQQLRLRSTRLLLPLPVSRLPRPQRLPLSLPGTSARFPRPRTKLIFFRPSAANPLEPPRRRVSSPTSTPCSRPSLRLVRASPITQLTLLVVVILMRLITMCVALLSRLLVESTSRLLGASFAFAGHHLHQRLPAEGKVEGYQQGYDGSGELDLCSSSASPPPSTR